MQYKTMGVMLDMSRNAVMKVSQLKKYIDYLAAMGFNALELYPDHQLVRYLLPSPSQRQSTS